MKYEFLRFIIIFFLVAVYTYAGLCAYFCLFHRRTSRIVYLGKSRSLQLPKGPIPSMIIVPISQLLYDFPIKPFPYPYDRYTPLYRYVLASPKQDRYVKFSLHRRVVYEMDMFPVRINVYEFWDELAT